MRPVLMLVLCLGIAAVLTAEEPSTANTGRRSDVEAVRAFAERRDAPLVAYRARRTLTASTRGGRMRAALVASTSMDPVRGFEWTVIEEHGSGLIRNKVLKAALEAEARMARTGEAARGALTGDNYAFAVDGEPDGGMFRIGLRALRKDALLLNGSLLLAPDGDLVRVEGHLVKRPSFWTRTVWVTRQYGRVGGVRVPIRMTSRADVRMAGSSDFEMVYDYESVNGQPVTPVDAPEEAPLVSGS